MSIIRWEPFDEMMSLRGFFTRRPRAAAPLVWQPATEVFETDSEVVVKAELPGIDPKSVTATITAEGLSIKGEAKADHEEKGCNYYRRELRYGAFQRTIPLPTEVKSEETKASFRHGILEVRVPKAERVRPKTVKVEVEG